MADKKDIKVAIRVRKLIKREEEQGLKNVWTIDGGCQLNQKGDTSLRPWIFDRVFDQQCTTEHVYNELVKPIVDKVMLGFNGTVFAYGQTSSGKTYTMMGATEGDCGILPRCIADIYNAVESTPDREFLIRVSFIEIYNEIVTDLLHHEAQTLDIREYPDGRIELQNCEKKPAKPCTENVVTSTAQALNVIKIGEKVRHYGSTAMNEKSSRSHTIFRIVVESRERGDDSSSAVVLVSHLNLVDLAGSENAKQTGATGMRLVEGSHINKSLFTLGQVINQLSTGAAYVSYRDCKLTRILQSALGGNSMTAFICCVTPAVIDETVSTLRFASSAKTVKNRPIINEASNDSEALMRKYRRQIMELEQKLQETRSNDVENLQQQLAEQCRLGAEKDSKIQALSKMLSLSSQIADEAADRSKTRNKRRETWGGGRIRQLTGDVLQPRDVPTFIENDITDEFLQTLKRRSEPDRIAGRMLRGPAAGATRGSSSLCSVEECLEVDSPNRGNLDYLEDNVDYQRRSFEQLVIARSKQSLECGDVFSTVEAGVQTEPVNDICGGVHVVVTNDDTDDCLVKEVSLEGLQKQLVSAQATVEHAVTDAEMARAEAEEAKANFASVVAEFEAAKVEVSSVKLEMESIKSELEAARSEVEIARSKIKDLELELETSRSEVDSKKAEISSLKSELDAALSTSAAGNAVKNENESVAMLDGKTFDHSESSIIELQKRLEAAELERDKVRKQASDAAAEIEILKAQLEMACLSVSQSVSCEADKTATQVFDCTTMLSSECQELKEELERSKCEIASLNLEWTTLQQEMEHVKSELERAKTETENMKTENESLKLQAELWKSGMERSKFEVESLSVELEQSRLDVELDKTMLGDESQSEVLLLARLSEERARWDAEKKELMGQIKETFQLSVGFADQLTLLQQQLAEVKKDRDLTVEFSRTIQRELDELREFTKYEKDFRDASIIEHQEEIRRECSDEIVKLEKQLLESSDSHQRELRALQEECDRLRLLLQQKDADSIVEQRKIAVDKETAEGDAADEDSGMQTAIESTIQQEQPTSVNYEEQIADLKKKLSEQAALAIDAQDELMDTQDKMYNLQTALDEKLAEIEKLSKEKSEFSDLCESFQKQLSSARERICELESLKPSDLSSVEKDSLDAAVSIVDDGHNSSSSSTSNVCEIANELLTVKKEKEELEKMYNKLTASLQDSCERSLADCNRDQYIQKLLSEHERQMIEAKQRNGLLEAENKAMEERLSREIQNLNRRLQKEICDHQLAEHKYTEAEREKTLLKNELSSLENIASRQDIAIGGFRRPLDVDPEKLQEHIKKLTVQLDLTNQRCTNYETKNKTLEAELKKSCDASYELKTQQAQLREIENQLQQKRDELVKAEKINAELVSAKVTLEDKLYNLERSVEIKMASAQKRFQQEIDEINGENVYLKTHLTELEQTVSAREKDIVNIADEKRQLEAELKKMKNALEEEDVKRKSQHELEINRLLIEHEDFVKSLNAEHESKVKELIKSHQDDMTRHAADLASEFGRRTSEHDTEIVKMAQEMASQQDELNQIKAAHAQLMADWESKVASLKKEHEAALAELRRRHVDELASREDSASDVEIILTQKESEIADLECKLEALRDQLERQMDNMRRQQAEEISCLNEEHMATMNKLKSSMQATIDELDGKLQTAMEQSSMQLENARLQHLEEMSCLKADHCKTMNVFKSSIQPVVSEVKAELDAVKSETVEKLKVIQEQLESAYKHLETVRLEHAAHIEKMETEYNKTIEQLRHSAATSTTTVGESADEAVVAELERQLAEANDQVSHLQSVIASGRTLVEQLQAEKQELSTTVANYETELDDLEAERDELTKQRDSLVLELKISEEAVSNQSEQLEVVEKALTDVKQQYEEMKQMFDQRETELLADLENMRCHERELRSTVDQYTSDKELLQSDLERFSTEKEQLESILNELRREKENADLAYNELVSSLQKQLETKSNEAARLVERVAELEQQLQHKSDAGVVVPEATSQLQDRIEELTEELNWVNKKFRGMEAAYKQATIDKFKAHKETLAAQRELDLIVGKVACSESGISFTDAMRGHQEEMAKLRAECDKLRGYVDDSDRELHEAKNELRVNEQEMERLTKSLQSSELQNVKLRDEIQTLRAELENQPSDGVAELRRQLADSRLRINKLEHQLMKEKEPLLREVRGLKADLERSEELRRHLQNDLRRAQNAADVTYAGRSTTSSTVPPAVSAAVSTANRAKPESVDPANCGTVGMMLLSRTETENAILKRKNEQLTKTLAEYREKLEKKNREVVELRARQEKREVRLSPRRALSPRQDRTAAASETPSTDAMSASSNLRPGEEVPNNCRQQ